MERRNSLLNGKFLRIAWELASRLVYSAIGTAGDKADDLVTVKDSNLASVRGHIFLCVVVLVSIRRRLSWGSSGGNNSSWGGLEIRSSPVIVLVVPVVGSLHAANRSWSLYLVRA